MRWLFQIQPSEFYRLYEPEAVAAIAGLDAEKFDKLMVRCRKIGVDVDLLQRFVSEYRAFNESTETETETG